MEKIVDVAQYIFIEYKNISGKVIDEMKLQKLLYLTQRESLAITGEPMFVEEFEGWKYGPVCREVRGYYTEDGTLVGLCEDAKGKIDLELYDTDGILYFELTNGEDWVTKGTHINTTNYRIDLIKNGQVMDMIDVSSGDYMNRSYTGLWFCSFSLDHGILNPYNPLEGSYPSWMMEENGM